MGRFKTFLEKLSDKQAKDLIKDIKEISIQFAEGKASRLKGKKYKNPKAIEKDLNKFDAPDSGYDKVQILIKFNDGQELKGFRYDIEQGGTAFTERLTSYLKKFVTM